MARCVDCNRESCPLLHLGEYPATDGMCAEDAVRAFNARMQQIQRAQFDCLDHRVNWRERALAAEVKIAKLTERAEAMTRAGIGTVEPWAQAGREIRRMGDELLAILRPLPAPPEQ